MVYPLPFYAREPTAAAQPKASVPFSYNPALSQFGAMRPPSRGPPASAFPSPATCAALDWPPSPELLSPASPSPSPSPSPSQSQPSPCTSPSPRAAGPPLLGQPVLSDDQLLEEMFQRSSSLVRRFPSLSMDDALAYGQVLGLPTAPHTHTHALAGSPGGSLLSLRGLSAPPALAIPPPLHYHRAFSSPPMLASARAPPLLASAHAALGSGAAAGRKKAPATRICRVPGCTKGIRSRGLCKGHGGGRRCQTPGCDISDQGGGHCIAHGGGRRCSVGGCLKSAQSKGLCKLHGGARLCRLSNCSKNGQIKGLCRLHYSLTMASAAPPAGSAPGRRG